MNTIVWNDLDKNLDEIIKHYKNNEVIAFPTETVYGLGGYACSDIAVEKIFQKKFTS